MHIIWILLIGLVIRALAKLPSCPSEADPSGGVIITSLLGIAGAVVAHLIGRGAGWYGPEEPAGFLASILGAVLVLAGYRWFVGRDRGVA